MRVLPNHSLTLRRTGWRALTLAIALIFTGHAAQAQSLQTLVEQALASEPGLLAAEADLAAAQARFDQRAGALWPQVEASLNTRYNDRQYTTRPQPEDPRSVDTSDEERQRAALSGRASAITEHGRYNSSGGELELRMPIIRPGLVLQKRQAASEWAQARFRFEAARQQLMFKVADAWIELLLASQEQRLANHQVEVDHRQMLMVRRGAELGSFSAPQANEAFSRLASARADAMSASHNVGLKRLALEHLVGGKVQLDAPEIDGRKPAGNSERPMPDIGILVPKQLEGASLEQARTLVEQRNPNIRAADLALEATRLSVKQAQAAHWPTLDVRAALERNAQGLGTSAGQPGFRSTQASIGVDLRIPIFSGGTDSARVREAAAQLQGAEHERESTRRKVQAEVHQAWYQLEVSKAKLDAATFSMKAADSVLAQATRGASFGAKSELDVLQAQAQVHQAKGQWLSARLEQLRSTLQLSALLGELAPPEMVRVQNLALQAAAEPQASMEGSGNVAGATESSAIFPVVPK